MEEDKKELKKGFFKKVYYSIFKLEKYGEMSAEGVGRAIKYLLKLSLILAIIISLGTLYQVNQMAKKGVDFIEKQVGEFTYKDGNLQLESNEPVIAPSQSFGKIIIDTNIENEEDINNYLNSFDGDKGILILKDKVLIKGASAKGVISYDYNTIFEGVNIYEINKDQVISYVNGNDTWKIYTIIFVFLLIYSLINSFLPILFNAVLLSLFGYLATWFARIRIRFAAIFNLAVYSLTLSVLLHGGYITVNIFTDFIIKYFQVMYIAVAAIYLIAAIFMIKTEFLKRQIEVAGVVRTKQEEQETKEEDKKQEEQPKNEEKEGKKEQPKKEDKKEEKKGEEPETPEGSEA